MREFQKKSDIAIGALFVGFVGWSLYGAIRFCGFALQAEEGDSTGKPPEFQI